MCVRPLGLPCMLNWKAAPNIGSLLIQSGQCLNSDTQSNILGFFSFGVVHLSGLKLHLINLLLILYLPRANIPLLITVLVRKGGPLHFRLMLQENPATEKKKGDKLRGFGKCSHCNLTGDKSIIVFAWLYCFTH